jgi:hypothetical protein
MDVRGPAEVRQRRDVRLQRVEVEDQRRSVEPGARIFTADQELVRSEVGSGAVVEGEIGGHAVNGCCSQPPP